MTGVRIEVTAAGKGLQLRTGRMEIRNESGQLRWGTADDRTLAATPPLRVAQ